ncbi:addiction module protein [Halomonas sp. M20]|uniref:addiction module protein n=1 Tax=Halomonas sp. M20 TaxID=2763264 RepID=UPI001D0A8E87|nr:addiction module protein [Halomonas sp. M20]
MNASLHDLPIEQRIQLVEDLWDSIESNQQVLPFTQEQRQALNRRLDAFEADGDTGRSADSVLSDIRSKL